MESLPPLYTAALLLFISFGSITISGLVYAFTRAPAARFALNVSLSVAFGHLKKKRHIK